MSAPPLAVATEYGRSYAHPLTGEALVSVTTALKAVAKPNLNDWIAKVTAEYVDREWGELAGLPPGLRKQKIREAHYAESMPKADLGSLIHEVCDNWVKGVPSEPDKATDPYVTQYARFLMDYRPRFIETEVTVGSRSGYAGTADAIAEINGKTWIIDYKSGGIYPEYGMQLAALRNADYIIGPDGSEREMPRIDFSGIVRIRPRSYKFIPVFEDEACFSAFLGALEVFKWFAETAEHVLGEPQLCRHGKADGEGMSAVDAELLAQQLATLGRDLTSEVHILSLMEEAAVDAEADFRLLDAETEDVYAEAFKEAEGSVEARKCEARLKAVPARKAAQDAWREMGKAKARVRVQNANLAAMRERIGIGRSLLSRERTLASLAGIGEA